MSSKKKKFKTLDEFKTIVKTENITHQDLKDLLTLAKDRQEKIVEAKQKKKLGETVKVKDLKNEYVTRIGLGDRLLFRIKPQMKASFEKRYTYNGSRRIMTIGEFGDTKHGLMTLRQAKDEAALNRSNVNKGIDPIEERKRSRESKFLTVDDVAVQWLDYCRLNTKNPHIQKRVYDNDIKPIIGGLSVERIDATDILRVLEKIRLSGRPTIANDALSYCKQILAYAVDPLRKISFNPAKQLTYKNAGGREYPRERILEKKEIKNVLQVLRDNQDIFTRENYIAFCLLLNLGVRKGELIAAKWHDFDFKKGEWILVKSRTKTREEVAVPIVKKLYPFFDELRVRSAGSDYLFPNRRTSIRRGYISDDTLNHALAKLFGDKRYSRASNKNLRNIMAEANIAHFVIHDLRRSFRTLLSELKTPTYIAERCLNHKPPGIIGNYDRYTYFAERKEAMKALTKYLIPLM